MGITSKIKRAINFMLDVEEYRRPGNVRIGILTGVVASWMVVDNVNFPIPVLRSVVIIYLLECCR
jgi:hypothetical protein